MSRFVVEKVVRAERYSLGTDSRTGRRYLSIPVANRMVDYQEYYALDEDTYRRFLGAEEDAARFAEECRQQDHDDRLILPPGTDRGTAI